MSLKRVMTIVRLDDGRLVIHNAIALDNDAMRQIEGWGTPSFMIVPNGIHRLDAPAYKRRYPALEIYAPSGSRTRVEEVVEVTGTYQDFPDNPTVRLEPLPGVADAEGVMIVKSEDGVSIVLSDAVFNMDRKRDVLGFLFTTLLGSAPGPRVSRLAKMALIKDRPALRSSLETLADTPDLVRVIVAHEKIARGAEASRALKTAATFL
jgi:hypothetical protein